MKNWDSLFLGIQLCISMQLTLVALINLIFSNGDRNKILGFYCLIIAQFPIIIGFHEEIKSSLFLIITVWAWKGQFIAPLLFLFLVSLSEKKPVRYYFIHLIVPTVLYLLSVFNSVFVEDPSELKNLLNQCKYFGYWSVSILYFVKSVLAFNRYTTVHLKNKWKVRYRVFYLFSSLHLIIMFPMDMIMIYSKLIHWEWLALLREHIALPFYTGILDYYCLALCLYLVFFAFTELSWFKKHFTNRELTKGDLYGEEDLRQICNTLRFGILNHNLHKRPKVAIGEVSHLLELSQNKIKEGLSHLGYSGLNEFINYLRIEEVKANLQKKEYANYDFLSIAKESGFTSKASFYRVFKKYTGKTPSSYLSATST